MPRLPNLPLGKSSFESIRENNDLYVDKTRLIHQMASQGEYYFLSRPRRFGKSLTVSTLRCLFEGRRELCWVGLYPVHPVNPGYPGSDNNDKLRSANSPITDNKYTV